MYVEDSELDDMINKYHIGDELKTNKEILNYLRRNYNNNHPIITKKKFEDIWDLFKNDMCSLRMNQIIYEIMEKIIN